MSLAKSNCHLEKFLYKVDHKNMLFILLKSVSGVRYLVGAILVVQTSVDVLVFFRILMLGLSMGV